MTDTKNDASEFSYPYLAGAELEHVLSKAEALLKRADLQEALELLTVAEKRYVRAAKLFDLIGDVLLRCDRIEEGVRYKTLHEVLKGTFKIATDEAVRSASRASRVADWDRTGMPESPIQESPCPSGGKEGAFLSEASERAVEVEDFMPFTSAMGHEFMRQGHYDRALEIFTVLAARHPEDLSLHAAKEVARKKSRQAAVLEVLQRWLGKIERMKSRRSSEA
ncbi:MAG: hypothetical protein WBG50_17390 [Desulfomonilaceae bacterium]